MIEIVYALVAMLFLGVSNAIAQKPIKDIGALSAIFYRGVVITTILLGVFVVAPKVDFEWIYLLYGAGLSLFGLIPILTFFKGLEIGKVGVVTPIASSNAVITVILAIVFFGEKFSLLEGAGVALVIIGTLFLTMKRGDGGAERGVMFALIAALFWGVLFFIFKIPVNIMGPILTVLLLELGTMVWSFLFLLKGGIVVPTKNTLKYLIVVGVIGAIGSLAFLLGIGAGKTSIVVPIVNTSPLAAAVWALFAYKEKLDAKKWISIFVIIAGIVLVTLGL